LRPEKSEVERLCSDISKAKDILNWHPKVDLRSGLALTLDWFKNRPAQERASDIGYVI
jgi:nucleoside-diphosphate-sugar epimerase